MTSRDNFFSILDRYYESYRNNPHGIVLIDRGAYISYACLNDRSDRFKKLFFTQYEIGYGKVIVVCMYNSIDLIAIILSILKTKAAFLLIDPKTPKDRLLKICDRNRCDLLITDNAGFISDVIPTWLYKESTIKDLKECKDNECLVPCLERNDIAYLVCTSGSTGEPKSIAVSHHSIANYLDFVARNYSIDQCSHFILCTSIGFDLTLTSLLFSLCYAHTLHIIDNHFSVQEILYKVLNNKLITHLKLTPSHLRLIKELTNDRPNSLKVLLVGGEVLTSQLSNEIVNSFVQPIRLINEYGPSETTIGVSYAEYSDSVSDKIVPVGQPITGAYFHCDGDEKFGELLIGGDCVALGYYSDVKLTAEKFIPDTLYSGQRVYKSGDIFSLNKYGDWVCIGRQDNQIKVRGHRVDVGEIEHCIQKSDKIISCIVSVYDPQSKRHFNRAGGQQLLCAYIVVSQEFSQDEIVEYLRGFLSNMLPEYMIPSVFIIVHTIPITTDGKVDYAKLPEPISFIGSKTGAEKSELHAKIAKVWSEVLHIPEVNIAVDGNFIEYGGDSISAVMVANKCKERGINFAVHDLFAYPTIESLSKNISISCLVQEESYYQNDNIEIVLSPIQEWYFHLLGGANEYNQSAIITIKNNKLVDFMPAALKKIVEKHEVLRTMFSKSNNGFWSANIGMVDNALQVDKGFTPQSELTKCNFSHIITSMYSRIDIIKGPLICAKLISTTQKNYLILVINHLLVDAVSWAILLEEIVDIAEAMADGSEIINISSTVDYYSWVKNCNVDFKNKTDFVSLQYWSKFESFIKREMGSEGKTNSYLFSDRKNISEKIHTSYLDDFHRMSIGLFHGYTETSFLYILGKVLSDLFQKTKFLVQLENFGRDVCGQNLDLSRVVGWCTALNPVMINSQSCGNEWLDLHYYMTKLSAIPKIPFGYLGYRMYACEKGNGYSDDFLQPAINFNYLGKLTSIDNKNINIIPIIENRFSSEANSPYYLDINIYYIDEDLVLSVSYDTTVLSDDLAQKFVGQYKKYLQCFVGNFLKCYNSTRPLIVTEPNLLFYDYRQKLIHLKESNLKDIAAIYPITPMQKSLLFYEQHLSDSVSYHQTLTITLDGHLDCSCIKDALQLLGNEHEALRTLFLYDDFDMAAYQLIFNSFDLQFDYYETSEAYKKCFEKQRYDFKTGPLIRAILVKLAPDLHKLIFHYHHILFDGWSLVNLFNRFFFIVASLSKKEHVVSKNVDNYPYYSWLQSNNYEEDINYWRSFLSKKDTKARLNFTIDANYGSKDVAVNTFSFSLTKGLSDNLRGAAKKANVTLSTVFHAIWGLLSAFYCNSDTLFFGSVVSGRAVPVDNINNMVGLFINTIPVFINCKPSQLTSEFLADLQLQLHNHEKHAHISYGEIQALSEQKNDLISSLLVIENYPLAGIAKDVFNNYDLPFSLSEADLKEQTNYNFTITFFPEDDIHIDIQYNTTVYSEYFVKRIEQHFKTVSEQMVLFDNPPIGTISLLNEGECKSQLKEYCYGAANKLQNNSIPGLFCQQVSLFSHRIAVVGGEKSFSYAWLDKQSTMLAAYLRDIGVNSTTVIGILVGRHVDRIIAWLAVLKTGACYVPLDTKMGQKKLGYIFDDAEISILLTHTAYKDIHNFSKKTICLDSEMQNINNVYSGLQWDGYVYPEQLAYIIYTSGSTGQPKGVMMDHRSVCNHFFWMKRAFSLNQNDKMLQILSFSFDPAITELYVLLTGGMLIFLRDSEQLDLLDMQNVSVRYNATIAQMVPSIFKTILSNNVNLSSSLEYVICGAEVLEKEYIEKWYEIGNNAVICNLYGVTEACIDSTSFECRTPITYPKIPIGKPIDNVKVYILDEQHRLLPENFLGELYLAGNVGLAYGYVNNPTLTAEKFIPDKFASGQRMYSTGDLAKFCTDGNIQYLGRKDRQIKLRGIRVELAELENILRKHAGINEVVFKCFEKNHRQILCAYFVSDKSVQVSILRKWMLQHSSSQLLPDYFIRLDEIPLMSNNKIDYDKLVLPKNEEVDMGEKCRNETERKIREIWSNALGVSENQIPLEASFFEIGGNSLSLMRVHHDIHEQLFPKITVEDLFLYTTISRLGEFIASDDAKLDSVKNDIKQAKERKLIRRKKQAKNMRKKYNV